MYVAQTHSRTIAVQNYNKNCTYASVRVFFCKKIEFILLFYAQRWLWMLAYGRYLGA